MRTNFFGGWVLAAAMVVSTGCGALQAVTNPGASWALGESPSMTVILRRAELSRATTDQVDRFIAKPVVGAEGEGVALTRESAKTALEVAAKDPAYEGQPVRVVPSEAWVAAMSATCPAEDGRSLISMLGSEAELAYTEVSTLGREQAQLTAQIAALKAKADADGVGDADRVAYEKEIAGLEAKVEALEASFDPKAKALFALVEKLAAAAPNEAKTRMTPVVLRLSEAVEDAEQANAAAIVRYPLAMPAITDDLQRVAKRYAADVVEEQTGHRPDMRGLSPGIALDGTDIRLTLNGIPDDQLGDLDPAEVVAETTRRTQSYFGVVLSLLAYASETQERLAFQSDLLEAWRTGLGASASSTGSVDITDLEVITAAPSPEPPSAPAPEATSTNAGPLSPGGLRLATCETPVAAAAAAPLAGK